MARSIKTKQAQEKFREDKLWCPCCGKFRPLESAVYLLSASRITVEKGAHPWRPAADWAIEPAKRKQLTWACDLCLHEEKAIPGKPWLQTFCDHNPYFAFFDETRKCRRCKNEFVFSASEKKYWYETLKFWVQSVPNECADCRKALRKRSSVTNEIGRLMKNFSDKDIHALLKLSGLYLEIPNRSKAVYYLSLAEKQARQAGVALDSEKVESLRKQIARL